MLHDLLVFSLIGTVVNTFEKMEFPKRITLIMYNCLMLALIANENQMITRFI
jgi:hypothetical protein